MNMKFLFAIIPFAIVSVGASPISSASASGSAVYSSIASGTAAPSSSFAIPTNPTATASTIPSCAPHGIPHSAPHNVDHATGAHFSSEYFPSSASTSHGASASESGATFPSGVHTHTGRGSLPPCPPPTAVPSSAPGHVSGSEIPSFSIPVSSASWSTTAASSTESSYDF
ncbi:hypothetical protein VNI00_011400 [Paramarasmius palmivorus]|uniref:Uncharacterized protein n=1 Tax=Paramarasmius palmivorus TaxID=297713 RepID=A0AAW0CEX9_9AGAR